MMTHFSPVPPGLLSVPSKRNIGEGRRETVRGLFVGLQEQSALEAVAGQPDPQRENKMAFNMGTGTLTSAL